MFGWEVSGVNTERSRVSLSPCLPVRMTREMFRSMGKCLTELNSLTDLAGQIMEGGNPSTSVLLGTRGDFSILIPRESPLNRDSTNLTVEEKLELVRQQMAEVGEVQENIKELREKISEKYADRLADNMTSCVTQ